MDPCKYAKYTKCDTCNVTYYSTCKKFVIAHAHSLTRNISPFVYKKLPQITSNSVWGTDINVVKSAAMTYAIKDNSEVKKISLSQVLSFVISNQELEANVYYIDASNKPTGDLDKIKGVLISFIDDVLFNGGYVALYTKPTIFPSSAFDFPKI